MEAATQACATAIATAAFKDITDHEEEDKAARLLSPSSTTSPSPPPIAALKDVESIQKLEQFLDNAHNRLLAQFNLRVSNTDKNNKGQSAENNQSTRPLSDITEYIHNGRLVKITGGDWTKQEKLFRDIILPIVSTLLFAYVTSNTVIKDKATFETRFNSVFDKEDNQLERDDDFLDYTGLSLADFREETGQTNRSKHHKTNEKAVRHKKFQGHTPSLTLNMTGMSANHTIPLCIGDAGRPEDQLYINHWERFRIMTLSQNRASGTVYLTLRDIKDYMEWWQFNNDIGNYKLHYPFFQRGLWDRSGKSRGWKFVRYAVVDGVPTNTIVRFKDVEIVD